MKKFLMCGFVFALTSQCIAFSYTGKVVDTFSSLPVENAAVFFTWNLQNASHHALHTTDKNGYFYCSVPSHATNSVTGISKSGYQPVYTSPTTSFFTVHITPERTYSVIGIVHDEYTNPVENAHISIVPDDADLCQMLRGCDTWTDEKGHFRIDGILVSAGECSIHIMAQGYVHITDNRYRLSPVNGDAFYSIGVKKGVTISGYVRFCEGDSPYGIRVWAEKTKRETLIGRPKFLTDAPFSPIAGCFTYTDSNGVFVLHNIPENSLYQLYADYPGAIPGCDMYTYNKYLNCTNIFMFMHKKPCWLNIKLTNADAQCITNVKLNARINILSKTSFFRKNRKIDVQIEFPYSVQSNGTLFVGPIPSVNTRSITFTAPDYLSTNVLLQLTPFRTNTITQQLQPAPEIHAYIRDPFTGQKLTHATARFLGRTYNANTNGCITFPVPKKADVTYNVPGYIEREISALVENKTITVYMAQPYSLKLRFFDKDGNEVKEGRVFVMSPYNRDGVQYRPYFKRFAEEKPRHLNASVMTLYKDYVELRSIPCVSSNICIVVQSGWDVIAYHECNNITPGSHHSLSITQKWCDSLEIVVNTSHQAYNEMECDMFYAYNIYTNNVDYDYIDISRSLIKVVNTYNYSEFPAGKYTIALTTMDDAIPLVTNVVIKQNSSKIITLDYMPINKEEK